jgi:lytic murein transglycosylase
MRRAAIAAGAMALASPAHAASCGSGGAGFSSWLEQFKRQAVAQGISSSTVSSALAGVTYDPKIIRLDRSQRSFKLSFEQFYARRVSSSLISRGRRYMAQHRDLLDRMEKRFGVPAGVVIAIWGLETNYGSDKGGNMSIFRSLATLGYDCRRSAFFTNELMAALRIVDRGDMSASQMRGGWAGEIGQTQFLPSSYFKYAVDFDGNGHRDLINSVPDILASTANFLKAHGWVAGQPWGPGTGNHRALEEWNRAEVYQRTIAVMAEKLER